MITDKSTRGVSQQQSERRLLGQSHNLPRKAPQAFAEAIVDIAEI
jgi:hypothetical protein